jgi:hypothetical protein
VFFPRSSWDLLFGGSQILRQRCCSLSRRRCLKVGISTGRCVNNGATLGAWIEFCITMGAFSQLCIDFSLSGMAAPGDLGYYWLPAKSASFGLRPISCALCDQAVLFTVRIRCPS